MITVTALERYCRNNGPGIPREYLEDLRKKAYIKGVEERHLKSGGFSYFPSGSGKKGRIFKIAEVKDVLFLEFNAFISFAKDKDATLWLTPDDRKLLHAGGVEFCYIGSSLTTARLLIAEAIQNVTVKNRSTYFD